MRVSRSRCSALPERTSRGDTTESWTARGLVTYYVLFFLHIGSRKVHIVGMTPNPDEPWMMQVARNLTIAGWGFLGGMRYAIMDRDTKFTKAFSK